MRCTSICLLSLTLLGCSGRPSRIEIDQQVQPTEIASRALAAYDTDGDAFLSATELNASPGLRSAMRQVDINSDGKLDAAEISARVQSWLDRKTALMLLPIQVERGGEPLVGATVRFVPEEFMGTSYGPAAGVTDANGTATLAHAPEFRPDPDFAQGIKIGFYRIEVRLERNGVETIPARYNDETTLGQEVAADGAGMGGLLTLRL